jgi:Family of unknown function (DUF5662)
MSKHIKYSKYVIKHKWYVFLACCKYGLIWRGIIHDWTKFLPVEWFPYVEYFYGGKNNKRDFEEAWLHHQKMNKHHWQWWVMTKGDGTLKALPMPDKYRKEMLADWQGAGRVKTGKNDVVDWYLENQDQMILHDETRAWVESELKIR